MTLSLDFSLNENDISSTNIQVPNKGQLASQAIFLGLLGPMIKRISINKR